MYNARSLLEVRQPLLFPTLGLEQACQPNPACAADCWCSWEGLLALSCVHQVRSLSQQV